LKHEFEHDFQVLERQLLDVVDVLDEAGIVYHLEGGTLLGIVREQRLLPWDHDTDISIMRSSYPRFLEIQRKITRRGWRVRTRVYKADRQFAAAGTPRLIKIRDRKAYFLSGPHCLDIFIKELHEGAVYWQAAGNLMKVDASYYDGYDEVEWRGRKLKAPRDFRAYLTEKYGDWSVTVKDWHCRMENTIVEPSIPKDQDRP